MILQCPECKARYVVPDQSIGASGRTVRCAGCSHTWFQAASIDAGGLEKMLDAINARKGAKARPIPPGSNLPAVRREWLPAGFIVSLCVASAAAIALLLLVAWPGIIGFPRSEGLALADVGITKIASDDHQVYEINGKIYNTTAKPMPIPTVRVTLVDKDGESLDYWYSSGNGKILDAGKTIPFTTGNFPIRFSTASRFVIELGNPLELALRRKPK